MRPATPLVAVVATIAAVATIGVAAPVPVAGTLHGNHVSADAQVVADGRVVVEEAFTLDDAFLVVHADDGGSPGKPLGSTAIAEGRHDGVAIRTDGIAGPTRLYVALHRDENGDDEFTPGTDPILESFDRPVAAEFWAKPGDRAAFVLADDVFARQSSNGSVTVPHVRSPTGGYVVLRADDDGRPGSVVGFAPVDRGSNREVEVRLDPSFVERAGPKFRVWAVLYEDDGDGSFDPDADDPVTVEGTPVGSAVPVAVNGTSMEVGFNTPTTTTTTADGDRGSDTTSTTGGTTTGGSTTGTSDDGDATTSPQSTVSEDGAADEREATTGRSLDGFTATVAAIAGGLALALALAVRRDPDE